MSRLSDTDYLRHWNIDQAVFARSVPPQRIFAPMRLETQVPRLALACAQSQPVVLITGEPGTGKSTLLKWLTQHLSPTTHDVLLLAMVKKERQAGWLTPRIAHLMGETVPGAIATDLALETLIRKTAARLDELIAEKRRLVVAIDAAHFAETPAAFDELVAFLNLQSLAGTCLTFVLGGSESLLPVLDQAPELATRVALHVDLQRLTREETGRYVQHRLALAGLPALFDDEALDLVHLKSRGLFASINTCGDNCLVEAFQRGERRVTLEIAKAATENLGPRDVTLPPRPQTTVPTKNSLENGEPASSSSVSSSAVPPPPGKPASNDGGGNREARKESASISLSSLFKSDPSRQKP